MRQGGGIGITIVWRTASDYEPCNEKHFTAIAVRQIEENHLKPCLEKGELQIPIENPKSRQYLKTTSMSPQFSESGELPRSFDVGLEKCDHVDALRHQLSSSHQKRLRRGLKLVSLAFVGCCVGLVWLFSDCLPSKNWKLEEAHSKNSDSTSFGLVKYQVPSPTPSATGLLECFQVYQPVLTPNGATAETTLSGGSEDTTTLAPTDKASSCEVVLMQHDFAFSYGIPFVGEFYLNS